MAYFAMLWKARTIERYRLNYESEKINSIMMSKTQIPKQSLSQRWRHYRYDTQKRISRTFKKWYPEGSALSNFLIYLKTDQTFPNFVLKSFLGFIGGIVLTYLCFIFFVFQLSISLINATIMSSVIGVLLTLGLAFSYRIRCLVFLLIPQFFSRMGRFTLTCYALVLILTGPATNTLKNSEVLSESLACGQEQIKTSVNSLNLLMTKPLNNLKYSIELMVERLRRVAVRVKEMTLKINRLVLSVAQVIQTGYLWLASQSTVCNEKLGNPYFRCMHSFQDGIHRCKKEFSSNQSTFCIFGEDMKKICSNIKHGVLCVLVEHVYGNVIPVIKKRLANFSDRIKHMLFMEVHVHHSYSISSNTTRTASQVAAGIVTEIRKRADPLLTWLSWSSCVTSLFLLLIIFRAKNYQHMFETRSRFDNRYITKEIRILDLKRLREGKETILPLNRRERAKYVTTTSFRLVATEKAYLNRSIVFMTITTFKLLIHMVADYSLYWVLMTIRYHGRLQSLIQPGALNTHAHISGSGPTADLLKAIISSLNVLIESAVTTPVTCLPNPNPPDFKRYSQIGVLIFLLWFFAIFEPYGLRLRHVVMGHYQPDRAKARAVWLYNHILRTRGGFMKFARRKLHRVYKYRPEERLTFRRWLNDRIPFQWLRSFLGSGYDEPHCLLCGTNYYKYREDTQLIRCKSSNCPGIYCTSCFSDIGELCTVCLSPDDYGDSSDVSLEKGSSDESDSEDDATSRKEPSFCDLDICESGEYNDTASMRSSRKYKTSLFSPNKGNSKDSMPLLRRKNMTSRNQPDQNFNNIIIIGNNVETIIKRASIVRHRRKYRDLNTEMNKRQTKLICCLYCDSGDGEVNFNCKTYQYEENDRQIKLNNKCSIKSRPTKYKRCDKRQTLDNSKHHLNAKRSNDLSNLRNKSLVDKQSHSTEKSIKSLPYFTKFVKRTSQCSFYSITVSENSINVDKINHRATFHKFLQKRFSSAKKCKMKSRKNRKYFNFIKNTQWSTKCTFFDKNKEPTASATSYSCEHDHKIFINKVYSNEQYKKPKNKKVCEARYSKPDTRSCYSFRKLRMLFSDNWQNIRTNIALFSLVLSSSGKNDINVSTNKKNHKRRKKMGVKSKVSTSDCRSAGVDNEETRKYRISAYLAEQDWMKRHRRSINARTKYQSSASFNFDDFENCDPFMAWSDYSTSTKKYNYIRNHNKLRKAITRYKSNISEGILSSLKCSISLVKGLWNAGYENNDYSFFREQKPEKKTRLRSKKSHESITNKSVTEVENSTTSKTLKKSSEKLQRETYEYTSSSCSGSESILSSSIKSDVSIGTNATICSLAYLDRSPRERKSRRTKVVTKANQATETDRPRVCDVSTTTEDWWSPMVEKRRMYKGIMFDKGTKERDEEKKSGLTKKRAIKNDAKLVQFRSQAQIIPTDADDVMSPSRYLLESQKYYNELFSSRYYAPHLFSVNMVQKCPVMQKKPSVGIHQYTRRNHKMKRLEECYSPRKQISPRRKSTLYEWTETDDLRRKSRKNIERMFTRRCLVFTK